MQNPDFSKNQEQPWLGARDGLAHFAIMPWTVELTGTATEEYATLPPDQRA
jgi:hypothetical protein